MKVLELFAGSRSIGRECDKRGWEVFSVDWQPFEDIDLAIDIEELRVEHLPFIPDMVWMSPDCTSYSIAAISHHRTQGVGTLEPKSEYAQKCDRVNKNALHLLYELIKVNPALKFFIENPRGGMRKMDFMQGIPRTTVTYCSYGDTRMKPTDIWSNHLYSLFNQVGWRPKQMCFNGNRNCHHEPAPRGSKTGTQGLKGSYERSKIPDELVREVLDSLQEQELRQTA